MYVDADIQPYSASLEHVRYLCRKNSLVLQQSGLQNPIYLQPVERRCTRNKCKIHCCRLPGHFECSLRLLGIDIALNRKHTTNLPLSNQTSCGLRASITIEEFRPGITMPVYPRMINLSTSGFSKLAKAWRITRWFRTNWSRCRRR